jgi:hypothetical protein
MEIHQVHRPGEHTYTCLGRTVLSIQQAIISGDDQSSTIGTRQRVFVVQKEVHLKDALDRVVLHLPVGPPAPPHRWWRRSAGIPERTAGHSGEGTPPRRPWVTHH